MQIKLNKLFKEADGFLSESEKVKIDREINLLKLEKLVILMCFEAPSLLTLLGNIKDENDIDEILTLIRTQQVLENNRLNQSSLNFEVLIDLIKQTTSTLLPTKEEIYDFIANLNTNQTQEVKVNPG